MQAFAIWDALSWFHCHILKHKLNLSHCKWIQSGRLKRQGGTESYHRIQLKKKKAGCEGRKKHENRKNREKAASSVAKLYPLSYDSSNGVRLAGVVWCSVNHGLCVNKGGLVNLRWDESTSTQICFSVFSLASQTNILGINGLNAGVCIFLSVVTPGQQSTSPTVKPGWAPGNY